MKSFTDSKNRIWTLSVNVAAIKRVRALCDVDIYNIVEFDEKNNMKSDLLERISNDPVLLVDILYSVCKPECDRKNISDEDFGESMNGDVIECATNALLHEIADFFPEAKRLVLNKMLKTSEMFRAKSTERIIAALNDPELDKKLESRLEQLNGLFISVPDSAV